MHDSVAKVVEGIWWILSTVLLAHSEDETCQPVLELNGFISVTGTGDVVSTTDIYHTLKQYWISSCVFLRIPFSLILLISSCFRCCKATGGGSGLDRAGEASLGGARNGLKFAASPVWAGLGTVRSSVSGVSNVDRNNYSSSLSESQKSRKSGLSRSLSRRPLLAVLRYGVSRDLAHNSLS